MKARIETSYSNLAVEIWLYDEKEPGRIMRKHGSKWSWEFYTVGEHTPPTLILPLEAEKALREALLGPDPSKGELDALKHNRDFLEKIVTHQLDMKNG